MVATGLDVTAVEAGRAILHPRRRRCDGPGRVTVVHGGMLDFSTEEPFDAAVFFESFHHCADHLAMLRRLHRIVRPGGAVLFAARAGCSDSITPGAALDGLSVWSSRTYGWLELGFDGRYFDRALHRNRLGRSARSRRRRHGRGRRDRGEAGWRLVGLGRAHGRAPPGRR